MSSTERAKFNNPVVSWIDERMPIFTMMKNEYGTFPTPKNFNYFWNFGALAMFMLVTMIVSGLFLAMNYAANTHIAFDSVERIMRDVNWGWFMRYLHANGASMFFLVTYVHIYRGLYYGSYKKPRELLWLFGVVILLLLMATAFMGYVLPWGQMSFWGATVITNLFSALPLVGKSIVTWLWGGFSVDNPTLNRFFAFHFVLPFVICAVVFLHVWALHVTGSNNPLGIEPQSKKDTIPFHPYYTTKDSFGLVVFLIFYMFFVFFAPNVLGHPDNYIPANPMQTPPHIVPEWYFLPFYAILRAVPDVIIPFTHITLLSAKLGGVLAMFGAIGVLFILPWMDRSPIRSAVFRPYWRISMYALVVAFVLLGCAGYNPADANVSLFGHDTGLPWLWVARAAGVYYFVHFLVFPILFAKIEPRPALPPSIHEAVLNKKKLAAIVLALVMALPMAAQANEATHPKEQYWSFDGFTGTYDRASVQRGYLVYKQVCSACHSMSLVAYRNLMDIGLSELQVKALASEITVVDGPNDEGDMFERPGIASDRFKAPFANEKQARASNNGAYPPDLSLIAKARHNGPNYIYSLLTGYGDPPSDVTLGSNMHYNKYFPGHQIAMAPPLVSEGQVAYPSDGPVATVDQMAWDVTNFLMWAAEPKLEVRKQTGIKVIFFLIVFALVMYAAKRKVWEDVEH